MALLSPVEVHRLHADFPTLRPLRSVRPSPPMSSPPASPAATYAPSPPGLRPGRGAPRPLHRGRGSSGFSHSHAASPGRPTQDRDLRGRVVPRSLGGINPSALRSALANGLPRSRATGTVINATPTSARSRRAPRRTRALSASPVIEPAPRSPAPHAGLAPAPPPPPPPLVVSVSDPGSISLADALDLACPISGTEFLTLHRLLIIAFAEAPDELPWAARLTFEPPILRAPPEHPHCFPDHHAWRPVSVDWLNFLNDRSSRPLGAPPPMAIRELRVAFSALFPTNSAEDLPPPQTSMRALLRLPAAQYCLARVSYRPALPLARRFFNPSSGGEVSRAGIYDLFHTTRNLLDLLPEPAAALTTGVLLLRSNSLEELLADLNLGLPPDPCPARPLGRATLQYLSSQLSALRSTGLLPSDSNGPPVSAYHHRTLDAIDSCHQWLWPILGATSTPLPTPDRACLQGETPWLPWLTQWFDLRRRLL